MNIDELAKALANNPDLIAANSELLAGPSIASGGSHLEEKFAALLAALLQMPPLSHIPVPVDEFRFHPTRKWRFDFAWPDQMVAVEVEGGLHNKGRHIRPEGFKQDCIKYNAATLLGWSVFRLTRSMIEPDSIMPILELVSKRLEEQK